MWWTDPIWLLLVAGLFPLFYRSFFPVKAEIEPLETFVPHFEQRKLRRLVLLRVAAFIAVIFALAGFSILLPSERQSVAVLLDVSGSIDHSEIEQERTVALRWIQRLNSNDRVVVLAFAGRPSLVAAYSTPAEASALLEIADLKAPHPEQTDLLAAIHAGKVAIRNLWGNRTILLFSDGRSTAGGVDPSKHWEEKGIVIHTVPVGRPSRGPMSVALELPKNLREGEPGWANWVLRNDRPQKLHVIIKIDGHLVSERYVPTKPGYQSVHLELPAQIGGIHRVELLAMDEKEKLIAKADGGGILRVNGAARILVVHNQNTSIISRSLAIQGFQVMETGTDGIPEEGGEASSFSTIILDNVPATDFSSAQQESIRNYVSSGGGLLVVGGDASLGRGGYFDTPLEEILPVQTDTRQRLRFTRANILFVIDRSGSMSDIVGKSSKQLAAMKAIIAATKGLNPTDEVGILAFSSKPTWALPFTPASDKETIREAINNLESGGGTELNDALDEAIRGFAKRGPVSKHVILLTDGITGWEGLRSLCEKLRAMGATITTIGVGDDVNEPLLRSMARWGMGRYYRADKDKLPQIMVKETVRVTRDLIQEGSFSPVIREDGGALTDLKDLPPIKGYLLTKPKSLTDLPLVVGGKKKDPLLAIWRYGGGQVAVFTSDSGQRWLTSWLGEPIYNRFWAQLVRSIERSSPESGFHMSSVVENGWVRLSVEALDEQNKIRTGLQLIGQSINNTNETFRFEETAPGHYEAAFPLEGRGLRELEIRDELSGEWIVDGLWTPPGLEYRALGPDRATLSSISNESGGKLLSTDLLSLPAVGWSWAPVSLQFPLIILTLALFLVELAARSLSLGQFTIIQSAWALWQRTQAELLQKVRDSMEPRTMSRSSIEARQSLENQRYMAGVVKRKGGRDLEE